MASSSSDDSQIKHDVFISFRGKDVRRGFLSHLVKELHQKKVIAYVDDKLNRGEDISCSLLRAIQESQISIVIFSENYAFSRWCLDELAEIIERMKRNKQIVLPVFYYIDPSNVRHQKGTYELKFEGNGLKVQNWRSALRNAADLSGHDSSRYRNDAELVDEIVKDVLLRLNHVYPNESKGLVGIDRHLDRIKSFLEMESKEVQILGIWGMSGVGKTTIAEVAYEKFSSHYDSSCIFYNEREKCKKRGPEYLRQKLISKLQKEKSAFVLKGHVSRSKVFVVLDDVSTLQQLEDLIKGIRWGPGSKFIVTSKNKKALNANQVHEIYEVKELNFKESLALFSLNAFGNSHPEKGYEELSERAVGYAKGLPLALKVLGLDLRSRDRKAWESTLGRLEKHHHPEIQEVFKISYDRLDVVERDIFLDIAFFYKGEDVDHVKRLLDANGLFADSGIEGLLDKSLVSISNENTIQMHDLIQTMGREIVHQECPENPGRRSRLKDYEEVYDVLRYNKGTDAIKGIVLYASLLKDVQLNVDTFKNMTNLRVIKFYSPWHVRSCHVHHLSSFESLSDGLRGLEWVGYPYKSLPSSFYPDKLVEHSMPNNHVKEFWKLGQGYVKSMGRSLARSKRAMELLDISKAQNTELEHICSCESFCSLNPHVLSLSMILSLNLVRSKDPKTIYSGSSFRSPRNFDLSFSCSIKEFSLSSKERSDLDLVTSKHEILYSSIGSLSELRRIIQGGSKLEIPPINELCCLRSFEELDLSDYRQMNQSPVLHNLFDGLLCLKELYTVGCRDFFKVPDLIGTCSSLKYLGLKGSSVDSLPAGIKNLPLLKTIYLTNCRRLLSIPELPPSIMHLDATNCVSLKTVSLNIAASAPHQEDILSYFFSFVNCLKLDEHSLCNIKKNACLSLERAVHKNFESSVFCFPSSRVPEWFRCEQPTEASITMLRSPAINELLGFVFWAVLRQFTSNVMCSAYLKYLCYFEDGEELEGSNTCYYRITELYSDHVFLWYDPIYSRSLVEAVKMKFGKGEDIPKISFKFCVVAYDDDNDKRVEHECLVKECGVRPIYASGQPTELAPEFKMHSKWGLDKPGYFKGRVYSRKRKKKDPLTISELGEPVKEAELTSDKAAKVARVEELLPLNFYSGI